MARNLRQSIVKSLARYIAIVAIIALGSGMFVGLRTTKSDMIATGQRFMDEQNMFDLRLLNTYGWSLEDEARIAELDGIVDAEGVIWMDVITRFGNSDRESVYKFYSIPEKINQVYLLGGRMPRTPDECLADGFHTSDAILGKKVIVTESNSEDTLDSLSVRELTIVGYVSTPLYMDMTRGSTSIGNGTVSGYLYLPRESFDIDYYPEIHVTLAGDYKIYSDTYNDFISLQGERLETDVLPVARDRFSFVLKEAEDAYAEGYAEYKNGLLELEDGKLEAEKELADALKQLQDAEAEIEENRVKLEDGLKELEDGQKQIDDNLQTLAESKVTLAKAKADAFKQLADANADLMKNYIAVNDGIKQINNGIKQIEDGISQIDSGISQLESGLQQLEIMVSVTKTMISVAQSSVDRANRALETAKQNGADGELIAELEATLAELQAQLDGYQTDLKEMEANQVTYTKQLEDLKIQRQQLIDQRAELEKNKAPLEEALEQINMGFMEIQNSQTQAENQFAAAEAEIEAAQLQLENAQRELDKGKMELEDGQKQLLEGEQELEKGWADYYEGKEQVEKELADAQQKLDDAKLELSDARKTIDEMDEPEVYALGRNTNVGYLALESNSDIVEGVSAVFPAFFLLIAALVCITTMTRMVEEERTQIGTLKALGYGNGQIVFKYIAYAGSAAVLGCGFGMLIGSVVFPMILWEAYGIIMQLGNYLVLRIDWPLCLMVIGMYTAVTLAVTWYCCRMSLREVPAQLIRPKPPTSGKKILLEYLPFWNKLSFLNKVMLRNVFRYHQRLFMMLVGIGGCTALLLTGFGIRDSIVDIVSFQFEEITLSDMEVYFTEEMYSEKQIEFLSDTESYADSVLFYHQSSMELVYEDWVNDINFVAAGEDVTHFMDFHFANRTIPYPDTGEALLSVGVAEKLGIREGDSILVRNADMEELSLRVGGIFENYVYNYVIVSPETVQMQWDKLPTVQMAYLNVKQGVDLHEAGAKVSDHFGVANVSINADLADQVGSMLEALDLIVITVVICAGLLAVIVLYNLTNINITERIREIATIKVLGFNSAESAAYVFKENLFLSALGSAIGLVGGIFLLEFVMTQIKVDMVWMPARLMPMSYVWAVILTMLSAVFVDFVLYFRLEKINMAEALKSVE